MELRNYQKLMLDDVRGEFRRGNRRTCLVAPCGAGKTVIMGFMAGRASGKAQRVLIVVHRQELIEQSCKTLKNMGLDYGVIAPKHPQTDDYIQVGMVGTVNRRLQKITTPDLIIFDECHHCLAETWGKIIEAFPKAYMVGLTATPCRLNGSGLGDVFQSLVPSPQVRELINWGYLSPFKYLAPPVSVDLNNLKVEYGDYIPSEVEKLMDTRTIVGDVVQHYQKLANGAKAVCYCAGRNHSKHTAEAFQEAGISAVHIDGTTPKDQRREIIEDFRTGKIKILCNVDLISEGFDVPNMEAVILLRPTQSLTLYIQQSMRAMRADPDNPKKTAVIIDHVGNCFRFGLPDENREWSLKPKKNQKEIEIKICPDCFGVCKKTDKVCPNCGHDFADKTCPNCFKACDKEDKVCPNCGHIFAHKRQLRHVDGELFEVSSIDLKYKRRAEVANARTVDDLKRIAAQRGYKPGWIYYTAKGKGLIDDRTRFTKIN